MELVACPYCAATQHQAKAGFNNSGTRRYYCNICARRYTANPHSYSNDIRDQAIKLYKDGISFRCIGRILKINHQTVINWAKAYQAQNKRR